MDSNGMPNSEDLTRLLADAKPAYGMAVGMVEGTTVILVALDPDNAVIFPLSPNEAVETAIALATTADRAHHAECPDCFAEETKADDGHLTADDLIDFGEWLADLPMTEERDHGTAGA